MHSRALRLAKREILTRTKHLASPDSDALLSGVAGSADHRIQEAFQTLQSAGKPISPARLAKLAKTNFISAQRCLVALMVLRNKAIKPLLAAAQQLRPSRGTQNPTALDSHYQTIRTGTQAVVKELGIAA